MSGLLGPNGQPISSNTYNKKVPAPPTGEKYGQFDSGSMSYFRLPGGGALQFNLDLLTLKDFRDMRDHYQINSSLSVLMFLLHQMEWRIEVDDTPDRKNFYNDELAKIWTPLVRSKSKSFWSGFSPNIIQWENDTPSRRIRFDKIKDLDPELSEVKWRTVNGAGTNKIKLYDGITAFGTGDVPVDNTYWYPLLMEENNHYGRKLLKPAFQPWFFSMLLHLFANRYYERFGEPTPVGRAPYDDDIRYSGENMAGNQAMERILEQLRNRSAVVLPNDKTPYADETNPSFDYQIEYLESQMRGADFERYMTRLDEEMSLALFTPILLMRTADVGSYNLGTQHAQIYLWMLNAIAGDWKLYIDKYLLRPLRDFNFGTNAPMPRIRFRRMGAYNEELVRDLVRQMEGSGKIKLDPEQLGEMAGLSLAEVRQLTKQDDDPDSDPDPDTDPEPNASPDARVGAPMDREARGAAFRLVDSLSERLEPQISNAFKEGTITTKKFSFGFQNKFIEAFTKAGVNDPYIAKEIFFSCIEDSIDMMRTIGYNSSESFSRNLALSMKATLTGILEEA